MLDSNSASKPSLRGQTIIALTLGIILIGGAALRFYNVNWDEGTYHIHPDERHTAMVITAIQWPDSLGAYFDTSHSPLNPRNADKVFFYGTLPLFLTKYVATLVGRTGYDEIHLVGRVLSGLFDLGTVILLFFLARRLFDWRVGLAASFLLALTVLNIQGSHYFVSDTFLTFFVVLTIWFTLEVAEGHGWSAYLFLGTSMGFTLACKVSVFLLALVVALGAWLGVRRQVIQSRSQNVSSASLRATAGLLLAAMVAVAVFRVAQPYAWAGPNYDRWDAVPEPWGNRLRLFQRVPEPIRAAIMPNPQWIADIVSAGAQQTGEADMPWGRQWTDRTPWLFPLENMILWGLGPPLGVAAWLGVLLIGIQLVCVWRHRGQRPKPALPTSPSDPPLEKQGMPPLTSAHWDLVLVPLAWVLLTFFWQGMQFVKSIRYFLPIYPFFALFAAYLLISTWDWGRGYVGTQRMRWQASLAAGALAGFVLLGTLAWALAFIQIYREPLTRVQATRWMYEKIETAATLHYQTVNGRPGQLQIPLPATHTYATNGQWLVTPFVPPQDLVATQVVMNNLSGYEGPTEGVFEIQITGDPSSSGAPDGTTLVQARIKATFGGDGGQQHLLEFPDATLTGNQVYQLRTRALQGTPLVSKGAAIANEHFDDPLPFNMDGRIAFGSGPYRGLDLTLYDEDTPEKLDRLLDVLDEADYINMSSGRLWQSIPRLPMRYPVTTRYYELLFSEKLGFEKAAEFHSYPRIFGIEFDDTWAEEQFTVYDHPKVLIYRKTDAYDRDRVRELLTAGVEWEGIAHWLNPRDVARWRRDQSREQVTQERHNALMLTDKQRQVQTQGGTWASLFDRNSLANRWPTLSWLVLLGIVGLAALPLTVGAFRWLPDQGTILARPVGILLLAWLSWIITNFTTLPYSRETILLALALMAVGSLLTLLVGSQRHRLLDLWRTQWRLVLANELFFLGFFVIFWLIRWGNPDLWHPWMGGEKPMDFAYLNAVVKSTEFPPYDPWFAGGYLNYYYFGQVMVGTFVKLIGIVPPVAYNLVIPTWFALMAMGAFSVTYNLVAGRTQQTVRAEGPYAQPQSRTSSALPGRPLFFGLMGALFVAVLGNLGEIHLLLLKLGEGILDTFQSTIPGLAALVRAAIGSVEVIFGDKALPISINEWYWNASRAVPSAPHESVITEFPFFTFLYADLHAHLIALPLTFLSLSIALAVVMGASHARTSGWREHLRSIGLLLLWGLTIGAMRTTNTWDVPPHLLVTFGALAIAEVSHAGASLRTGGFPASVRAAMAVAWQFLLVLLLGWSVLYWPFWASYASFYNSLSGWTGTRTPLWAYLVVHGLFLFTIASYLIARVFADHTAPQVGLRRLDPFLRRLHLTARYRARKQRLGEVARIVGARNLPVSALVWIGLGVLFLAELFFLIPGLIPFTQADAQLIEAGVHAYRGLSIYALGLPMGLLGLLLFLRRGLDPVERLWAYLVLLGLAMTLGVEIIVIQGDIGRMNTVFKFYLQVWLIWGVAGATALAWLLPRLRHQQHQRGSDAFPGRGLWLGIVAVLLFCAALYPPLATAAKIGDRFDTEVGPGLDGWAYMQTARYFDPQGQEYALVWDLEAIRWLLDNVTGSPVILEGHTPEYRWGARYSVNTGLPAVLGWNWHQRQQRAAADSQAVWDRAHDVAAIYNTPVAQTAEPLLHKYRVQYIIVGPLERAYYDPTGLDKFEQMAAAGTLRAVFRNEGVTIYEVVKDG